MRIIKEPHQIRIEGKCTTQEDIVELFNFGMSIAGISKMYKNDNDLKIKEAQEVVEKTLYRRLNNINKNKL